MKLKGYDENGNAIYLPTTAESWFDDEEIAEDERRMRHRDYTPYVPCGYNLRQEISGLKEITAVTKILITAKCPTCGNESDYMAELWNDLDDAEFTAEDCDKILACKACENRFRVTKIAI